MEDVKLFPELVCLGFMLGIFTSLAVLLASHAW